MNQDSPRQPQEPPNGQQLFGQKQWKQHLPPYQQSWYNQPTQTTPGQFQHLPHNYFPPLKRQLGMWQWYTSRTKKVKVSIGCGTILAILLFFSCIGSAVGSVNLATQSTPTPTATSPNNKAAILVSPAVTHLPTPTPTPTQKPTQSQRHNQPFHRLLHPNRRSRQNLLCLPVKPPMGTPGVITFCLASLSTTRHLAFVITLPVSQHSLSLMTLGMGISSSAAMVHTVSQEENGEPVRITAGSHDLSILIKLSLCGVT